MKGELAKVPEQNESNLKERVVNLSNKLNFGNSGDRSVATIALLATLVAATIVLILWTSAKNYVPLYGNQESYDKANILEILDKEQITFRIDTDSGNILVPQEYLGSVITLCVDKRGMQTKMSYHGKQVAVTYELPMAEVVMDFFDKLKSTSRGFASLDYNFKHFQTSDMVRVDILINGERVDALAIIVHRESAQSRGRQLADALKELIPRQMFDIAIQAAIGQHVIARTTVKQLRKNVIAKCYGGDVSRKKKLLQKQKDGKKRMKQLGNVEVPQEAFLAILKVGK